jgi:hypothetical protein
MFLEYLMHTDYIITRFILFYHSSITLVMVLVDQSHQKT